MERMILYFFCMVKNACKINQRRSTLVPLLQTWWKKLQACKHCLRTIFEKIVDILRYTTIFLQFLPINAHKSALISTINPLLLENIWYNGKNAILGTFICLGTMWICGNFSTPKIALRTKINSFHVCLITLLEFVYQFLISFFLFPTPTASRCIPLLSVFCRVGSGYQHKTPASLHQHLQVSPASACPVLRETCKEEHIVDIIKISGKMLLIVTIR